MFVVIVTGHMRPLPISSIARGTGSQSTPWESAILTSNCKFGRFRTAVFSVSASKWRRTSRGRLIFTAEGAAGGAAEGGDQFAPVRRGSQPNFVTLYGSVPEYSRAILRSMTVFIGPSVVTGMPSWMSMASSVVIVALAVGHMRPMSCLFPFTALGTGCPFTPWKSTIFAAKCREFAQFNSTVSSMSIVT